MLTFAKHLIDKRNPFNSGILLFCVVVLMANQVASQHIEFFGTCPNTTNASNVDLTSYEAAPFYYSYSYTNIIEVFDTCSKQTFQNNSDGTLQVNIHANRFGFPRVIDIYAKTTGNGGTEYIAVIDLLLFKSKTFP